METQDCQKRCYMGNFAIGQTWPRSSAYALQESAEVTVVAGWHRPLKLGDTGCRQIQLQHLSKESCWGVRRTQNSIPRRIITVRMVWLSKYPTAVTWSFCAPSALKHASPGLASRATWEPAAVDKNLLTDLPTQRICHNYFIFISDLWHQAKYCSC